MRLIYLDEAGISEGERVSVVAGVIIDPDIHWRLLNKRLNSLKEEFGIPLEHTFHATDIMSGRKFYRGKEKWTFQNRVKLLVHIANIPTEFQLPVVYGCVDKTVFAGRWTPEIRAVAGHVGAFVPCVLQAEHYMRNMAGQTEIALLIAEDQQQARQRIKEMTQILQIPELKKIDQFNINLIPLEKISSDVLFMGKNDSPILQIADAISYIVSGLFNGRPYAREWFSAMFPGLPIDVEGTLKAGGDMVVAEIRRDTWFPTPFAWRANGLKLFTTHPMI